MADLATAKTVEVDDDFEISGGTLQITSGLLSCTNNKNDAMKISGGTLDVDGGEVRLGELANDPSADITMTSGWLRYCNHWSYKILSEPKVVTVCFFELVK